MNKGDITRGNIMNSGIYQILNIKNGKFYVGSSKHIQYRLNNHKARLIENAHDNIKLQNAWNKYGEKAFRFQQIESCKESQLLKQEQRYLDRYKSTGLLYNIAERADAPPSQIGKPQSKLHRKRIGMAHQGEVKSNEHRRKIANSVRKYYETHPESIEYLRQLRLGTKMTPAQRQHLKNSKKRGEQHHNAVLTENEVKSIRVEYSPYKVSFNNLAKKYGVDKKTIIRIIHRKTWTHV